MVRSSFLQEEFYPGHGIAPRQPLHDERLGLDPAARPRATDAAALDAGLRAYMLRVYNWMASGLALTAIVAYVIANTSAVGQLFFTVVRHARAATS